MKYRKHIILLLGLTLFFLIGYLSKNKLNQEVLVEVTSLKYQGQVQFVSKGLDKEFKSLKPLPYGSVNENWWYMLTLSRGNKGQKFFFTKSEYLYDVEKEQLFKTSIRLKEELDKNLELLEDMYSPYGSLISWEQAREVIPRMAKVIVRDLETGLTFNVQRRAGSSHADVQPLTAEDTKILKEIYGGRWSWKRRAIVVEKDGYKIAASMNGMPHGQGAITGNNFPGHFCIHFMDSTTHSNNLDLAHQLMVHKAAGLIEDYIKVQGPKEIVEIALTAIGQNDYQILVLTGKLQDNLTELFQYMPKIIGFKINALEEGSGTIFLAQIEWYESTSGRNIKEEVFLTVVKSHGMWVVDLTNLLELVQRLEKEN